MASRKLTIALDRYDRHIPFFMGMVETPPSFSLQALEVGMVPPRRDGVDRHKRMMIGHEFDIAEVSLASYIMSKRAGAPFSAVPVFPRRLFSQNHIFVNVDAGIEIPKNLIGKRVAIWAFQVTMSVLAKGDMQSEYGIPWREVEWHTERPEEIAWSNDSVTLHRIPDGRTGAEMLIAGDVDAYIHPHPPEYIFMHPKVRRLFPDPEAECRRYWDKNGNYPIMHVLAFKEALGNEVEGLPQALISMWDDAREQADEAYIDFNYTMMPFGRYTFERSASTFGANSWSSGLAVNRSDLERFIGYMADQLLIPEIFSPEELFHPSVRDT